MRFRAGRGLIVVATRLWGPTGTGRVRLALDTGATVSVVNRSSVEALGYDLAAAQKHVQLTTGGGVEFVPMITLERISALGHQRRDLSVVCHTLPATTTVDGVLGLDFLRGFRPLVDFRLGEVTLD